MATESKSITLEELRQQVEGLGLDEKQKSKFSIDKLFSSNTQSFIRICKTIRGPLKMDDLRRVRNRPKSTAES